MKNICIFMIIIFVVFSSFGCSFNSDSASRSSSKSEASNPQDEKTGSIFGIADDSNIINELTSSSDYIYMLPEQLYDQSDLVVVGRFVSNKGSFVESLGRIKTNTEIMIDKVIKGDSTSDSVKAILNGGVVPFLDYYYTFDEGSQKKMGVDLASVKSTDLIKSFQGLNQSEPLFNKQYLIFLGRTDDTLQFFLGSDSYSMLETKDDKYLDRTTNEWKPISDLGKNK